ncbi:MAG TPA: GNAT family N-acetyltransferase [Armatimonadota bacterium]|jgi:CelD/BcsL family acetyltransferase involved in cellulose biosynthesis
MLTSAATITYEVILWQGDLPSQLCADWDYLATRDTTSPFTHRAWLDIAYRHRAIAPWGVLVIRKGEHPIGLFPLRKISPWTWGLVSWFGQSELQLLVDPAWAMEAWTGLAQWFATRPGLAYLSLGLSSDPAQARYFSEACALVGLTPHITEHAMPVVLSTLPDCWEALDGKMRKRILTAERDLTRDYPDMMVEFVREPVACLRALNELIRLFRRRWDGELGGSVFHQACQQVAYHDALMWAVTHGYGGISVLRAAGRTLAVQTCYHLPGHDTLYGQLIARDTEALPNRYSPGVVLIGHMIRTYIGQGIHTIHLGAGARSYKFLFNGQSHPRLNLAASRVPLAAALLPGLDRALHLAQRAPIHAAYYAQHRLLHGTAQQRKTGK